MATLPTCGGQPASEYAETVVVQWNDLAALAAAFAAQPAVSTEGEADPVPGS